MTTLFWILGSTFAISLIAILGIFALFFKEKFLEKILLMLVGLSAGAMMATAFLHLIPEGIEKFNDLKIFYFLILAGFIIFFIIEKFLYWRHCHKGVCDVHTFGLMNFIGDGIHNFLDGLIIAAAFLTDINLGLIALVAIILHEIPQELSDFGVLVYAGFGKIKALFLNFISALLAMLGGLLGYFWGANLDLTKFLLPLAAGGFIYIAASDLLPELKKEERMSKFFLSFLFFLLGIFLMALLKE